MGVLALVSIFGYCISGYHDIDCDVLGVECDDEYFSIQEGECGDLLFVSFQIFWISFLCNSLTPYFTVQKGKWLSLDFDIDSDISFVQIILFPDV